MTRSGSAGAATSAYSRPPRSTRPRVTDFDEAASRATGSSATSVDASARESPIVASVVGELLRTEKTATRAPVATDAVSA